MVLHLLHPHNSNAQSALCLPRFKVGSSAPRTGHMRALQCREPAILWALRCREPARFTPQVPSQLTLDLGECAKVLFASPRAATTKGGQLSWLIHSQRDLFQLRCVWVRNSDAWATGKVRGQNVVRMRGNGLQSGLPPSACHSASPPPRPTLPPPPTPAAPPPVAVSRGRIRSPFGLQAALRRDRARVGRPHAPPTRSTSK